LLFIALAIKGTLSLSFTLYSCSQAAKCPSVELVVMDEFRIRPLCPASRGLIDLVRENTRGSRDRDIFDVEVAALVNI
jgi:hypothetical protein